MVADYKSEVRFSKFKMVDPKWWTKFFIFNFFQPKLICRRFYVRWLQIANHIDDLHVVEWNLAELKMVDRIWWITFWKYQPFLSNLGNGKFHGHWLRFSKQGREIYDCGSKMGDKIWRILRCHIQHGEWNLKMQPTLAEQQPLHRYIR